MATWPSTKAGTTHLDAGTDSPKSARADIYQNVQNVNEIIDMFNISSPQDNQILKYNASNQRFELAASTGETLTIVGDDSTGTAITLGETFKIAGSGGVTTAVSGDTLTISATTDLIGDTTPQLGGNLDLNSNDITGTGNISITGNISTDAIEIADNVIRPIRSNDILRINGATPTGDIYIGNVSDGTMTFTGQFAANVGSQRSYVNSSADVQTSNIYPNATMTEVTLAGNVTNQNRVRQHNTIDVDLAGYNWSTGSFGSGPQNGMYTTIKNTGASANNSIFAVSSSVGGVFLRSSEGNNSTMNVNNIVGHRIGHISYIDSGATANVTNVNGFYYSPLTYSSMTGTTSIDNEYAFYAASATFRATNTYAFYAANDAVNNRLGGINFQNNTIQAADNNDDLTLSNSGTGDLILNSNKFPSSDGTTGQVLSTDGAGNLQFTTLSVGNTVTLFDIKVSPGTLISGQTYRGALTEVYDNQGIVSISSDQISLPAGVYYVIGNGTISDKYDGAFDVYNVTDSNTLVTLQRYTGGSLRLPDGTFGGFSTLGNGAFTLATTKTIEIRHFKNNNSYGELSTSLTFIKLT